MSKDGVRMDPAKVEASMTWPDLKTVHDVRSSWVSVPTTGGSFAILQRLLHLYMLYKRKESLSNGHRKRFQPLIFLKKR